jgi:magnesium transporter
MKTLESLVRKFVEGHPRDAAKALEELGVDEAAKVMQKLSLRLSSLLFERLTPQRAGAILEKLEPDRTNEMLTAMPLRQVAFIFQYLDMGQREATLAGLPESRARQLRELMQYPEDTAGGMMEPGVVSIPL